LNNSGLPGHVKGYLVELIDCEKNVATVVRRGLSIHSPQAEASVFKFPVETVSGKGGRVVKYEGERVIDRYRVFVVVFSSNYLPISHGFKISSPWPFSRVYTFGQVFLQSRYLKGICYGIFLINMDSIHLPFELSVVVRKVEERELQEFISKLNSLGIVEVKKDNLIQKIVNQAEDELSKINHQEIPTIEDPQEANILAALTTEWLLRRIKKVLDNDIEIRPGGKHPYKVYLRTTGKTAPVPHHGELQKNFPIIICKELMIAEAYGIDCNQFFNLLKEGKKIVRR